MEERSWRSNFFTTTNQPIKIFYSLLFLKLERIVLLSLTKKTKNITKEQMFCGGVKVIIVSTCPNGFVCVLFSISITVKYSAAQIYYKLKNTLSARSRQVMTESLYNPVKVNHAYLFFYLFVCFNFFACFRYEIRAEVKPSF